MARGEAVRKSFLTPDMVKYKCRAAGNSFSIREKNVASYRIGF
jgi:hypothetical protein